MHPDITAYNAQHAPDEQRICDLLASTIEQHLPGADSKIWHAHPVWFLDGNPIVGYSRQKAGWRLMFWSGASFDEPGLPLRGAKFKDASIIYTTVEQIHVGDLTRWLQLARTVQWDYKNIVGKKGRLDRLV
jgi:hypothetical protein